MLIDKNLDIYTYLNKLLNIKEITELLETKKVYYTKINDDIDKNALVYFILREKTGYSSDFEEDITKYTIQIDLYSNINFTQLIKAVKKQMKENEVIKEEIRDGFEEDFKYHVIMRYSVYLKSEI